MTGIQELFDLTGRTALITGGAGFLGQQFSEALVEAGANVVAADINQEAAESFAESLVGQKGKASGLGLDVTDPESVDQAIRATGSPVDK